MQDIYRRVRVPATRLEEHGVDTIDHHIFHDFDAGIRHVQENPTPYVIEPFGEVQNVKRLLYVGNEDDGGDVVDVLTAYRKAWGHRMKGFQLQRKVESVEVAVCGFCDGERFIDGVDFNFEHHSRDLLYDSPPCIGRQTEITAVKS